MPSNWRRFAPPPLGRRRGRRELRHTVAPARGATAQNVIIAPGRKRAGGRLCAPRHRRQLCTARACVAAPPPRLSATAARRELRCAVAPAAGGATAQHVIGPEAKSRRPGGFVSLGHSRQPCTARACAAAAPPRLSATAASRELRYSIAPARGVTAKRVSGAREESGRASGLPSPPHAIRGRCKAGWHLPSARP